MDFIEVEIINWSKYNPRSDRKITVWFRFQNDFFLSQDLWGLNDAARLTFLFLLCEASKRQSAAVRLSIDYVCTQRGRNRKQIIEDIQCLADRGVVNPPNGGQAPDKVLATRQDKTGQDKQNTIAQPDGFAVFWSGYPRKVGRSKAESKYNAALRAGHSPDDLIKARDNYLNHLKENQTEAKYIKHGSTFMSEWKDWLDPSAGESKSFGEKKKTTLEVLKEALGGS